MIEQLQKAMPFLRNIPPAVLGGVVAALAVMLFLFLVLKYLLQICRPNEIMIFSGSKRVMADGSEVGYRVVFGGRTWRTPFVERADVMGLETIPLDLRVANAYSKGGIALTVHAIANVKVSSNPAVVMNAIERFLGRDPAEVSRVAKESLEGNW